MGLGVQAGESIVSPHTLLLMLLLSLLAQRLKRTIVIDRVMHDWQHRAISNSGDPTTAGVNEDVNSRNR